MRSIDFGVVASQAFGKGHDPSPGDRQAADEVLDGNLTMPPHGQWQLPQSLTWDEDPFEQRNWVAQFHMLRWLEPVRRVAEAGDHRARELWIATAQSWVKANPVDAPMSEYAWKDMVDGIRALVLVFGLSLVDPDDNEWLTDAIWDHGVWLSDEKHLGHSNHALHQHQALLVIGLLFSEDSWVDLSIRRLNSLLEESYDSEGVNAEGAIDYHRLNFVWWDTAFRRLDVAGIARPASAGRLDLALLELAYATKPNRQFERIGDTERGGPVGLSSKEIDYVNSEGAEGQPPPDLTRAYKAGYVFGRSGWGNFERSFREELFYSLSFGAANRVHGHQDGAALTLHANGHPWLIDAGKYAYKNDTMRSYCTSRVGHNVLIITGERYDPRSVVKLHRSSLSPEIDDFEFRDTGYKGIELQRRVVYCRGGDFFVVVDTVSSDREVTAHQRWHLDADTKVVKDKTGFTLKRGKASATIQWRGKTPKLTSIIGQHEPFDGWMSAGWMQKKPAPVIDAEHSGKRFRFVTVLGAGELDVGSVSSSDGQTSLRVTSGRATYDLSLGQRSASVSVRSAHAMEIPAGDPFSAKHSLDVLSAKSQSFPDVPRIDGAFTPEYWAKLKTWVRSQLDVVGARYAALTVLLEHLSTERPSDRNDQGLRASMVDLAGADLAEELNISAQGLGLMREPMMSWSASKFPRSATYKTDIRPSGDPADFAVPSSGTAIYALEVGGLTVPVMVGRGSTDSDVLSVRFHGAVNRTRAVLPVFPGSSAEKIAQNHFAIFSDPSLDLDRTMNLAWYLGTSGVNLYEFMAQKILTLAKNLDVRKIILAGNSGGGFTALQVGSYLPDCCVLAMNPQTDILSYHETAVTRALKACSLERQTTTKNDERLNVVERYRHLKRLPKVIYVQNMQDAHHVANHYSPFVAMAEDDHSANPFVRYVNTNDGRGHVAVPKEKYWEYWNMALARLSNSLD